MKIPSEKILIEYNPNQPYKVEYCKDYLSLSPLKPNNRNSLMLCWWLEQTIGEDKHEQ